MEDSKNKFQEFIKGPSLGYSDVFPKRQIWRDIASKYKGKFTVGHNSGNELEIHKVVIPYKQSEIIITASDTRPLKFFAIFNQNIEFDFSITWEDYLDKIKKKLGKKEFEFGYDKFDNRYFIDTKMPDLFQNIFSFNIQSTMLKYDVYSITYSYNKKNKKTEMLSVIQRNIGDKNMILELIQMYTQIIDNLIEYKVIK